MEVPDAPPPTESLANSRDLDDTSEGGQHNGTQQIAGASATDEAAIISAARGIGTVQNSRTNIKQAFFLKHFRFSGLESAFGNTADDYSAPCTRTASLDIGGADTHRTLPGPCPPPIRSRSSEKVAPEASEKLVATQYEHFHRYLCIRPFSSKRVLRISVLTFVILCIIIVPLVSVLYASHVFPVTSKSSLSAKDISASSSVQTSSSSSRDNTLISSDQTSTSVTTTSTSNGSQCIISSTPVAISPTTTAAAQPSFTSSPPAVSSLKVSSSPLPSSISSSSSAASPTPAPSTPTPTPMSQSPTTTTTQVPVTTLQSSTCNWGCYGWDCVLPSTPCNSSWQCINGYCKGTISSITTTSMATGDAAHCAWGGRPGMGCGDDNGCCDPYPCVSNICQNV